MVQQRGLRIGESGVAVLDVCSERVNGPIRIATTESTDPVVTVVMEFMLEPCMAVPEQLDVALIWSQSADVGLEVTKCMLSITSC